MSKTKQRRNIIALIYDFEGALTPAVMQDYTVFPELGISKSSKFSINN